MPSINPLLYSDNSESEVMATPGAKVVTAPELHAFQGFGGAVKTTLSNTATALWNNVKDDIAQTLSGGDHRYEPLYQRLRRTPELAPEKYDTINPLTTGTAAQVAAPLVADGAVLLASGGNPYLAGTLIGLREQGTTEQELLAQGIDADTARSISLEKGAETMAAFSLTRIPLAGRFAQIGSRAMRWGAKAGMGSTIVTGLDWAGGLTRSAILEQHGYTQQAEQMRHWDAWRMGGDLAGGTMLGLTTSAPISREAQMSGAWLRQADDVLHESAPGIPTTPEASAATSAAVDKALDDIAKGQPVSVENVPGIHDVEFLAQVPPEEIAAARQKVADHEGYLATVQKMHDDAAGFVERARRDGYHEEADHYAENVLPGKQAIVAQYTKLLDDAKDDLYRLENPGESRFASTIRDQLADHQADRQAGLEAIERLRPKEETTTPAAMAQAGETPKRDVVTEAKQLIQDAKSPVQQAIEQAAAEAEPGAAKAPPVKLTPEQQELVNMHSELRQLADATGDHDLHAELDEAMRIHQQEHMEAGKFNVAALCAIGM